jgi:acyl-CoA synthetase (AMP-forming)/AMP-acid ligase II
MRYDPSLAEQVEGIKTEFCECKEMMSPMFIFAPVTAPLRNPLPEPGGFKLTTDYSFSTGRAASLLFTSGSTGSTGSTGPPKGVVHSYKAIVNMAQDTQNLRGPLHPTETRTLLHRIPVTWISGFQQSLTPIFCGICIEFCSNVFSPVWFWERIKQGDVSDFYALPDLYSKLGLYFEEHRDRRMGPSSRSCAEHRMPWNKIFRSCHILAI